METVPVAMNLRFVRIISGAREEILKTRASSLEDVRSIKERHGEKIAAMEEGSDAVLGLIGLYPDRDEGGHIFRLTGIEVPLAQRGKGIEAALMEEAGRFIQAHKVSRLKFGTSPLLTANAELYLTQFGTHYWWREGTHTPTGAPWPYVSCECDFDDPLARPLDLRAEEVVPRSVLDWVGLAPRPRQKVVYSGPLSVTLPELTAETLAEKGEHDRELLPTLYGVFHALFVHGYGFAWFDRLPAGMSPIVGPCFYYVMNRVVSL
jgi:GNAT superfamily N-acetyltransferase